MEYTLKLAQFEGPLDLLLHLIQKAKIELKDIFVSEITARYLSYMGDVEKLDMDRASEFLNMAATLLYIKSRSLLPNKKDLGENEEDTDPEAELIERLRLYKIYKDAGDKLMLLEKEAENRFYKLPEELLNVESEIVIEDADAQMLYRAFLSLLQKEKMREPRFKQVEIRQDSFSIRAQKKKILNILRSEKNVLFYSLFEQGASRMEIAVTFVALLELWNVGEIKVKQRSTFQDIVIQGRENVG